MILTTNNTFYTNSISIIHYNNSQSVKNIVIQYVPCTLKNVMNDSPPPPPQEKKFVENYEYEQSFYYINTSFKITFFFSFGKKKD